MPKKLLKVCGMTDRANILGLMDLHPDFIGLIFYPGSPRYIKDPEKLRSTFFAQRDYRLTGVFVNEDLEKIMDINRILQFDYIQLHGQESPAFAQEIRRRGIGVVKAFGIKSHEDFAQTEAFEAVCNYYLFDYQSAKHGGTSLKFDWTVLEHYKGATPFLLSGGIGQEDTMFPDHPLLAGIDINSRFEISPGLKNLDLISAFMQEIK